MFAITAAVAVLLGLARYSPLAGVAACPAVVGALVGHRKARSIGGAALGMLSAYYWCFFLILPIVGSILFASSILGLDDSPGIGVACLVLVALASAFGGYLGGVVEISVRDARAERRKRPPGQPENSNGERRIR